MKSKIEKGIQFTSALLIYSIIVVFFTTDYLNNIKLILSITIILLYIIIIYVTKREDKQEALRPPTAEEIEETLQYKRWKERIKTIDDAKKAEKQRLDDIEEVKRINDQEEWDMALYGATKKQTDAYNQRHRIASNVRTAKFIGRNISTAKHSMGKVTITFIAIYDFPNIPSKLYSLTLNDDIIDDVSIKIGQEFAFAFGDYYEEEESYHDANGDYHIFTKLRLKEGSAHIEWKPLKYD